MNTLDDYEEGTWTPNLAFGGGSTGMTYTSQVGSYTKTGRLVFARLFITLSNKGSSTGIAQITNLPFASANSGFGSTATSGNWGAMSGIVGNIAGLILNNSTTMSLNMSGAAAAAAMGETNFTNTSTFSIAGFYEAAN